MISEFEKGHYSFVLSLEMTENQVLNPSMGNLKYLKIAGHY